MLLQTDKPGVSNTRKLFWLFIVFFCLFWFCWYQFIGNSISIKSLFKSSTLDYDSQNDILTQSQFFKLFLTGTKKIIYPYPYKHPPQITITCMSPDAHQVVIEQVHQDHSVIRKLDANDFTGDDYLWTAKGRPLYPPQE